MFNVLDSEPIFVYTQEDALEDGVLVLIRGAGKNKIVFSQALYLSVKKDPLEVEKIITQGFASLDNPHPDDCAERQFRKLDEDLFVNWNPWEGYVFMTASDL